MMTFYKFFNRQHFIRPIFMKKKSYDIFNFFGEKLLSWLFHIQIWNITYYVVEVLQFFKVEMDFRIYQTPFISQG